MIVGENKKKCPKCNEVKSFDEFYQRKNPRNKWDRFQGHCKTCSLKRRKDWYEAGGKEKVLLNAKKARIENPQKFKDRHKKWNWDSKMKALNAYGAKCQCCGEKEPIFLAIDHINNDGAKHRKELSNKQTIYTWLRKNNYPTGFQVLCHNCNMAKAWGECPHKI